MSGNKKNHFHKSHNPNNSFQVNKYNNSGNANSLDNSKTHHFNAQRTPHIDIKFVKEPKPVCSICGSPISLIAESLSTDDKSGYAHFDCVLSQIKKDYNVLPPMKVSYLGKGKFGIIEFKGGGSSQFTIKQVIEWESAEKFKSMQEMVEGLKK